MEGGLKADRDSFFRQFVTTFFSVDGTLKATPAQVDEAVALCQQSDQTAALDCMEACATIDFRSDLTKVTVPALVGDGDGVVPFDGSGKRTHEAIAGSELVLLKGAPHGNNVTHAGEFNSTLVGFLTR